MNHDAEIDGMPAADNAAFYFDRYPHDTAQWLAALGDEANAKAGDSSYDFRKILCELVNMSLHDGITHAFRAADQLIAPNNPGIKYLEQQYGKFDQARAAIIDTTTGQGSTDQTDTPDGTHTGTTPGTGEQTTTGTNATSGAGSSAGSAGTGTTVTLTGGCGTGNTTGSGQNTGIGQQGTLFIVHYSEFRASIPARRKKAKTEIKRLTELRVEVGRKISISTDDVTFLDRVEAADPVLEDLISTHRSETSIAGVLRAAGRTPEDLGLTTDVVAWLDTQIKAA